MSPDTEPTAETINGIRDAAEELRLELSRARGVHLDVPDHDRCPYCRIEHRLRHLIGHLPPREGSE